MSEQFSSGTKNPKQTKKKPNMYLVGNKYTYGKVVVIYQELKEVGLPAELKVSRSEIQHSPPITIWRQARYRCFQ